MSKFAVFFDEKRCRVSSHHHATGCFKMKKKDCADSKFLTLDPLADLEPGTNILDIEVPEHIKDKVTCGVEWVDDALGGKGFTPTSCGMITGTSGGGKTTFLLQLADSITGTGNRVLFNTGEESLYQVGLTVERLNLKNGFMCGQETHIPTLLEQVDKLNDDKSKKFFLFVDSVQCMDDGKYADGAINGSTQLRVTRMLTEYAKQNKNVIVMFVGQVTKAGKFAGKNQILHMIDLHLHIYIDEDRRSETFGERIFTNRKNRFGFGGRTYILGLDEKGLHKKGQFC